MTLCSGEPSAMPVRKAFGGTTSGRSERETSGSLGSRLNGERRSGSSTATSTRPRLRRRLRTDRSRPTVRFSRSCVVCGATFLSGRRRRSATWCFTTSSLDAATLSDGTIRFQLFRRHLALLGGTTTPADCAAALRHLARPAAMIHGASIAEFERAFAARIGTQFAVSFGAGRVGLFGILRSLGIGHGDEVLLPVPTHIVVANAIRYTGAKPVYVDCELDTFNIDLVHAASRVTPRTKALILQHGFGIPVDLDRASEFAERGLVLIEDCVHALGSTYQTRPVGTFGRAAFFSTEETKTISTTMGGVVVTDDPELARSLRAYQDACSWPSRRL